MGTLTTREPKGLRVPTSKEKRCVGSTVQSLLCSPARRGDATSAHQRAPSPFLWGRAARRPCPGGGATRERCVPTQHGLAAPFAVVLSRQKLGGAVQIPVLTTVCQGSSAPDSIRFST